MGKPSEGLPFLPPHWETARYTVADSTMADVPLLTAVFNSCAYVEPWDPTFKPVDEAELAGIVAQSLADEGDARVFRLQVIRPRGEEAPVGYFHLWHRRPRPDEVGISMFVIDAGHRGHGAGEEIVEALASQLAALGYRAVLLEVYLKNWPALRFWIARRFTTINSYEGDRAHDAGTHASLRLARRLDEASA
ncbi:MAG TPA: GNAT family N-acetyltransferase [Roseiflexaceae bacterium]|nr:GNAT family N-acetyltransferase [Roseiflexaceae bacterium]